MGIAFAQALSTLSQLFGTVAELGQAVSKLLGAALSASDGSLERFATVEQGLGGVTDLALSGNEGCRTAVNSGIACRQTTDAVLECGHLLRDR